MSHENVETVRAPFRAFDRGDIDAVLDLCAEDIDIVQPAELPGVRRPGTRSRGRPPGLRRLARAVGRLPHRSAQRRRCGRSGHGEDAAERAGKDSGVPVQMDFTFLFGFRAGKIAEWRIFMHEADALAAVRERREVR